MTDDNTNGLLNRIGNALSPNSSTVGVLLALMVVLSAGVGVVAAANELADQTVDVNQHTQEVYLEVENTSSDNLNYTVYGIDEGITTEVDSGTISAAENDTTRKSWSVDADTYDQYRITVEENGSDSDNETADNIEIGTTVNQVSSDSDGGGPIFGGGGGGLITPMNGFIALLIVAAAFLLGLFDPIKRRITG